MWEAGFDKKSFFYSWIKSADNKDPQSRLNPKTRLHILNSGQQSDADFFSNRSYPELHIDPSVCPYVFLSEDSKNYIFSGLGTVQQVFTLDKLNKQSVYPNAYKNLEVK